MTHRETQAVHAGREDFAELGVHAPPLDLSTTYPIPDLAEGVASFRDLVDGQAEAANSIYARMHNPTVARFERALAAMEACSDAVAFASGMAAITACLLAAHEHGDHVLAIRPLYGTHDHMLDSGLTGLPVRWTTPDTLAADITATTALVIIETPANPTLDMVDIAAVAATVGDVPVLVDSTFATPVLQQPARLGATLVLHSATKFLGGHGDVIAGVVACNDSWAVSLRKIRTATGGLLHPLAAYLLHRGLTTLPLRVEQAQANAVELARWLHEHAAVSRVFFPGYDTVTNPHLVDTQMRGPGALISFELAGGHAAAAALMQHVQVATAAVSLGSVDTLIQHPAGLSHSMLDADTMAETGITPGLIRLSVGIEHVDDLWADLEQTLSAGAHAG